MGKCLNPKLYGKLEQVFGCVQIHNMGEVASWVKVRGQERLSTWGECYSVACPFCGDMKSHLWFSYLWGTTIGSSQRRIYPAVCYRRNCLRHARNRKQLYDRLSGAFAVLPTRFSAKPAAVMPVELPDVELPPGSVPLIYLAESHAAIRYLHEERRIREKGYTREQLWADFKVHATLALDRESRIIFPILFRGGVKSWVGRACASSSEVKYYCCPGTKISRMLYNYDRIKRFEPLIIVEGIFDALAVYYNITTNVVALFGKTIHPEQVNLLNKHQSVKYLCLDSDAVKDAKKEVYKLKNCKVLELSHGDPDSDIQSVKERLYQIGAGLFV